MPAVANPLFLKWVKEFHAEKDYKKRGGPPRATGYENAIRALQSCSTKYDHPKDLKDLNGIGPTCISRLIEKLEEHCAKKGIPMPEPKTKPRAPKKKPAPKPKKTEDDSEGEDEVDEKPAPKKRAPAKRQTKRKREDSDEDEDYEAEVIVTPQARPRRASAKRARPSVPTDAEDEA